MTNVTIDAAGNVTLPQDIRQRYDFAPDTPIRLIETRNGVLLVPLTCEPMSAELLAELEQWQALSVQSLGDVSLRGHRRMTIGDVYWADLPTGAGHAQAGRRPVIIVQGARASTLLPTVLIVPLTTRLEALRFPGTVLVESNLDNGLRRDSAALVHVPRNGVWKSGYKRTYPSRRLRQASSRTPIPHPHFWGTCT